MASLARSPNGRHRILVTIHDKRQTVSLSPKIKPRAAQSIRQHIEELAAAANAGGTRDPKTTAWLAGICPKFRARLAAKGLCEPLPPPDTAEPASKQPKPMTLGELLAAFAANKKANRSERTLQIHRYAMDSLLEFFGKDRPLQAITAGDAEDYENWLLETKGFEKSTQQKRCAHGSQFMRYAIRKGWIADNPFADVRKGNLRTSKFQFVSLADAHAVLAQLPDVHWKLLFALARFGGLRVGSEPRQLKWGHVDWELKRLTVPSPKTANHEGHGQRVIPLFPELEPLLSEAFHLAAEGEEFVLPMLKGRTDGGLRGPIQKALKAAGVEPWPRLWHNLRVCRQTELASEFPGYTVCEWMGNSLETASKHYLRVLDEHFERAVRSEDDYSEPPINTQSSRKRGVKVRSIIKVARHAAR